VNLFTIDFETYYDQEYSLSKMSTEDYVSDPRFDIMLVSVKRNDEPPRWATGDVWTLHYFFEEMGLYDGACLAHNGIFDFLILERWFNFVPKLMFDTLAMAQAVLKPFSRSISLDSCLKMINLGIKKGTEVYNMKGRTRASLTKYEMQQYANYCMDDAEGEYRLFKHLRVEFPPSELEVIDMTLRMYLQPKLLLDADLLCTVLQETQAKKAQQLASLPEWVTKDMLGSNVKFADLLRTIGIDPPLKISPITLQQTYAFAKNDTAYKEMEEIYADDPLISSILAARIGVKSTIEESRCQRLIGISQRHKRLRVPLRYYAAHTGRYGGMEGINMQNPPRVDKSRLRFTFRAPKDHVVLGLDLAQIEARIVAWLCGQKDLVLDFANKVDVYSKFASSAFKCETVKGRSKEDDKRRFVGKTCILGLGYGMGGTKLRLTLRQGGVKTEAYETETYVHTYRSLYAQIPKYWRLMDHVLQAMAAGGIRKIGPLKFAKDMIFLPNGMKIFYPNLRHITATIGKLKGYEGWVYDYAGEVRTLWGGKVTENIVQALARILVMDYMRQIRRQFGLSPTLQVHDELDYVVPAQYADYYLQECSKIMVVPPRWAPDLPVAVEGHYGPTFGDCK
jgi:hypothetical protein